MMRSVASVLYHPLVARAMLSLTVVAGVVLTTFVLVRLLPGDPVAFFANSPNMTSEDMEEIRRQLGLDSSIPVQLLYYLRDVVGGNLGTSMLTGQFVTTDLMSRLPASIELSLVALIIALVVAVPLGVAAALKPDSLLDHSTRILSVLGTSIPPFVTGLLMIIIFYYFGAIAPDPIGRIDIFIGLPPHVTGFVLIDSIIALDGEKFVAASTQLILPAVTMAIFIFAPILRMTRASMISTLSSEYIRFARANGLSWFTVTFRYALRNSLVPMVTTLGVVFSYMIGANVLVEKVFSWPGIGSYTLEAMVVSDYAPVQAFVLGCGILFVFINLFIDWLNSILDPRIRLA